MREKVVFIDVDGTLCNDLGLVPESAKQAIHKAQANGHKMYLCTGRSKPELYDFIMDIGFNGLIGAGGGYVESENEILLHRKFTPKDLSDILDFFHDKGIDYYIESNDGMYASEHCIERLRKVERDVAAQGNDANGIKIFTDTLLPGKADHQYENVNKICFLDNGVPIQEVKNRFDSVFTIIDCTVPMFGANSGEVILKGVDKATAMKLLLEHLQVDISDTLAIGDGMNDVIMLDYAHIGIAMGNAAEGLKAMADDITLTHDEGGIYASFIKYGLCTGEA